MPSVSVIIRTFRRPWLLNRALQSVSALVEVIPEVVVVCDGGIDPSVSVVLSRWRAMGMNLREVVLDRQMGRAAAWNAGLRAATGTWIASLDDDDTWAPDFLSSVCAEIQARGGDGDFGVVTQSIEIRERANGGSWTEVKRRLFNPELKTVRLTHIVLSNLFTNNSFVFPRAVLADVGYVREDLDVLEDWDFNVRFAARFPIHVIARPLAHYRIRPAGGTEPWVNSDLERHKLAHEIVRESWLRDDLKAGRIGLGELTLLAEIKRNWGLRFCNVLGAWLSTLGFRK
ncbi:MAG: glycosyltransferase family 2 protein [Opitutaceae bacterium]|jgi:glycosyltransferase involved in cell wall biosynthesis